MYFKNFPLTFYTLDNLTTVQTVKNILTRIVISEELKTNFSAYDFYDVKDGETPEMVAGLFYDTPDYHWIILHLNEILDPRFEWPLDINTLNKHTENKYGNVNGIHHYEDSNQRIINGNVLLLSNSDTFATFNAGDTITNVTLSGNAFVTSKVNSNSIYVTTTDGGFIATNQVKSNNDNSNNSNLTATVTVTGTPVTNLIHEEIQNESKRRIKLLKPQFLNIIVKDLEDKLGAING